MLPMDGGCADEVRDAEPVKPTSPNFFIVGAAKCGTTSMYRYLDQHPDAFVPAVKEPAFFAPDLPWQPTPSGRAMDNPSDYDALFAHADGYAARGEASTAYLPSVVAAERIAAAVPDARIVVMLRNPVELVQSLHLFVRYLGVQPEPDFARALANGAAAGDRWLLDYRRVVDFAPQLARYQKRFSPEQIHVILHDDLARDTAAEFTRLLVFLGLRTDVGVDLERENETLKARVPGLQQRLMAPSRSLTALARIVIPKGARLHVRRRALQLNSRRATRPAMAPGLRRELASELAPGIRALAEQLALPLDHWLEA